MLINLVTGFDLVQQKEIQQEVDIPEKALLAVFERFIKSLSYAERQLWIDTYAKK